LRDSARRGFSLNDDEKHLGSRCVGLAPALGRKPACDVILDRLDCDFSTTTISKALKLSAIQ
jgi:hypothetical protein